MAFNIAYTYQLIDKYTAPIQRIVTATRTHTSELKENQDAIKISNSLLSAMANRLDAVSLSLAAFASSNALSHLRDQVKKLNDEMDRLRNPIPPLPPIPGPHPPHPPGPGPHPPPGPPVPPGPGPGPNPPPVPPSRFSRFGAAASALTGMGTGVALAAILKQTASVENAMIDLGRATDLPAADLKKFEERFMSLSEKIGITTNKLAIMAFEGSKTGIDTKDLDRYVKITANAAVAFEILEDEAGRALGSIKAKMGLNIAQLEELMDRVNFVADATSADGERMINIIERLSGTFNTLHLKPEIASGFAAIADQLETSPELAASGMNMVISKMMQSSSLAKKMFAAPAETMKAVFTKLSKLPEAERIKVAIKMFGAEAARFAVKLAGSMELFDDTMKKAADSKAVGSMEREMKSKLKSLTMLWNNMKNAVTNVSVAIGEGLSEDVKRFGGYIRDITPKIREFVREHPGIVKLAGAVTLVAAAITLAVPIVWALGSAFAFIGAAAGLMLSPIGLAIGAVGALGAAISWRWDDWVQSGHPVPTLVNSIARRIGHLVDKFLELRKSSPAFDGAIKLLGKAFDLLGYALAIPLKLLDAYLSVLEKIFGIQEKITPIGVLTDPESSLSKLIPPNIKSATNIHSLTGGKNDSASVNGTITVKAEPGTDAKVSQPGLPTGSNLLMVKKQ